MTATRTCPIDIANYFELLPDPRSHINRLHPLSSVLVIAIMAILAGANGPTAIARWARSKKDFLGQCLPLPHGVPRKDVFRIVLARLHPKLFQQCFAQWLDSLRLSAMEKKNIDRPIFAIDGKTNRRSHDHANDLGALHSVSVWASELGLSLAQVACAVKSNVITAIPEVLQLVDITGAIITIDAMGTQKAIAKQIIEGKADYVLALKGNQEKLHNFVIVHIGEQLENDLADVGARQHTITELLHGHEEKRIYIQFPVPKEMPMLAEWAGLKTIGMAVRVYYKDGKEGSSCFCVGKSILNNTYSSIFGSMELRIFRRRYSSSRRPNARRWIARILLLKPSTNPSITWFSSSQ